MSVIWAKVKTYWTALVAAVLGVLVIAVNVLLKRNRKLRQQRDTANANLDHAKEVIKDDLEINEQVDERLAEAAREISAGSAPSELTDPNDNWLHKARKD